MLIERQVSIFLTGIGAALVVPEYTVLSHHQTAVPGGALAVGGVLGALGVFLGILGASDHRSPAVRVLAITCWALSALAFSAALVVGAVHSPTWGRRVVFGVAGALPIAGPLALLFFGGDG